MPDENPYGEGTYEGIPYEFLTIDTVDWTYRAKHIEERAARKGTSEFSPTTTEATLAALDPDRLVGPGSKRSIKVIGHCVSTRPRASDSGRVLKVFLVPKSIPQGDWWGASAMEANRGERRAYWDSREREEGGY